MSSLDEANAKHKHKHKHKCGDDLCKHRKHKKRRKHKKHHHREISTIAGSSSMLTAEKPNEEEDQCDGENSVTSADSHETPKVDETPEENKKLQAAKNALTKPVNIKLDKLEWPLDEDMISSITEDSSGSSYVRFINIISGKLENINGFSNDLQNPGKSKNSTKEKHSRIAAFLPARQLWAWSGKGYKRAAGKGARNKKLFYKTIQRGKETISVKF